MTESSSPVQFVPVTIQWMSGDITTISHHPRSSLYWLKRMILSMNHEVVTPHLLSLYTKNAEGEWVEYTRPTIQDETHFYAVVRQPIIHERLDYIYPMEGNDIWRFTYQDQLASQKQLSVIVQTGEWFCRVNEYHDAIQRGRAIPWIHTVEGLLEWYMTTEQGMALEEHTLLNWIYLWKNRR